MKRKKEILYQEISLYKSNSKKEESNKQIIIGVSIEKSEIYENKHIFR